jgi:PAS domain S-box-containing protein
MFRWRDDRYRALVDQAEEGFLVHDSRGKIRDANRRACETLGYSREELLSLNLADVQDRFRLEGAQSAWERIRPGQPATRLDQFLRKDGTRFPVEVRLGRLDLGGEALFLALVRDVEGRREAEKALTETERTFSAIFRSSPIASLLTSIPEATVLDANESFVRETGYLMEEMAGRSVAEVGLFASIEELSAVRADMNQDRKVYAREIRLRNKSGVIRTCLLSIVEILIGGRRCRLSSILDISDRKESEKALQESEARFRAAFEDVNLSICVLGLDGRFLQVNDATCRLFGYVRDELERMRVADVTHPDDIGISPTFMERAISGHSGHAAFVKRYVRRDGEVVWGQVSSSLVRAADGRPLCFISHLQDVTELQQAREDLELLSADLDRRVRERTAELESANRELESFSYSVSHDLRAPLRAIDGFSKRLADRFGPLLDEEGARLFGVIRTNSQRMAELIDDLLAFSRTSRGEIRRTVVNSSALARSAFLEVTPDAAVRDRIAFTVGELPDAWGDVKLLRQVWVNLLSNAVKFSARSEAPRIEVTGTVEEGQTAFHVRDNGVGFDMAYASKLFGVFQRLHGMNEFEGTGVGLALVHRIVSRHGGSVRAEAALGEGARFSFTLPAGVERAPARLSGEFRTFRG